MAKLCFETRDTNVLKQGLKLLLLYLLANSCMHVTIISMSHICYVAVTFKGDDIYVILYYTYAICIINIIVVNICFEYIMSKFILRGANIHLLL